MHQIQLWLVIWGGPLLILNYMLLFYVIFYRVRNMGDERLNGRIFSWADRDKTRYKNWNFCLYNKLEKNRGQKATRYPKCKRNDKYC